jgi:hypothetical protein
MSRLTIRVNSGGFPEPSYFLMRGGEKMKKTFIITLIGVFMAVLSTGYSLASNSATYVLEGNTHGLQYAYLTNINVKIQDNKGKNLMDGAANGPWFFVKVPQGQYTVIASHFGKKETKKVAVRNGSREITFHWKA